ncbi:hypothetical protein BCR33DRAFT_785666 [Rhizoclosmatium globosum]|uniref:TPPC8 first Ig-like domain-containing protein n=1 Tax=Rhizoclosmatium globosum TaxID=329046 RepID=A0A1Y2CA10_9FUNG|nr:hypothetical protein BCR33DRAFT_785666 [Rhizoclosmatium globosum]|eukprot:ORY43873.1 hypothetical protein BCR33DRAFT_785666 [Rhizoclosmatium globosum]
MESRFVHSVLSPLVAVVASTEAEEIARANSLPSVVELLQPFGQRIEGKVNVLDSAGHSSNLDGFALRFAALSLLPGPDVQAIRRVLVHKMDSDWPLVPPTEDAIASGNVTLLAPWYTVYRNYVCKYNGASEHESFNHPVACLLVTSTAAPNPIDQLKQLFPSSPDKLPQIFSSGFVDPQISLKHYVLLHDAARAPNVDADALFAEMKKHFGLSCRLIRVNSKADNANSFDASKVWEPFMSEYMPLYDAMHADPYTKLDSNIARASLGAITASEADLAASVLAVTSAPSAPIVPETPSVAVVVVDLQDDFLLQEEDSWEQTRQQQSHISRLHFSRSLYSVSSQLSRIHSSKLADYSFMLHDYKFAYSMYDSVKKDFQGNDRALKHFAGVQEMLALCVLMSDAGLRGNLESLLESSLATIWRRENYKEASALLLRMIGEDSDLRSAVLLEQSAFSHLKATPSQRRNTPTTRLEMLYRGSKRLRELWWSLIDDHNNFTIGRLHFHLGDPTAAFTHFTKLLKSGQQTAEQQASHWKEFLHIYKNIARTRPIDEVEKLPQTPVPVLIQSSINVSLVQTQHMDGNDLVELGFNGKPGSKPVKLMKTVRDGGNTICAVGEPVFVTFQIKNPLQIGLELNNVTLFAQFTKSTANVVVSDVTSYPNDGTRLAYDFFDLEYLPLLTLRRMRLLQLRVYPKAEGELIVQGLKLTLSDCVPVTIEFVKRGRRLNDTQKQRSGDPVYAADNTLKLTVTSPMPVLDVLFHSFPETLLSGQVERTVLEINNKGHRGLKNLKIKLSHPSSLVLEKRRISMFRLCTKVRENLTSREILNTANKITDTCFDNGFGVLKGKQTSFAYFRFTHDELRPVRPNPSPEKTTTEAIVNYIINENQPFTPTPVDLKISNITLQNNQVVCNSAPFNAFALQSRSVWRAQSLSIHYSAIPPEKLANTFTLYFTDDADIVLFWEAPPLQPGGPPRFGHHFIIGINLSLQAPLQLLTRIGKNASNLTFQSRSLYAATVSERKTLIDSLLKPRQKDVSPIRLILESEKVFSHDFSNCGDLILSFSARLRNTSWENSVSYSLELPSNEANAALENDFTWTGTTLLEGTLEPEQDTTNHRTRAMVSPLRAKLKENSERLRERAMKASMVIDRHVTVLRSKIRQPKQVQMIEKVTFLVGVFTLLGIQQLLLLYPQHILTFYVWTLIPLMVIRYVDFHRQKWHYFLIDFCYYVNAALFYFLIRTPTDPWLFKILFVWSNGPLMWAIVMWRSGLVFHSLPHITTIYIHLLPALVTYVIRWLPSEELLASNLCVALDCGISLSEMYSWPILLYLLWQALYLVKTEWVDREKLQADSEIGTSLRHMVIFYKDHPLGKIAFSFGPQGITVMYVLMQLAYTCIVSIPVYLFYRSQYAHWAFILFITAMSIWNGAGYYIFKLSKLGDNTSPPDSPVSERWYQRYIRRGPASGRRSSHLQRRGSSIDVGRSSLDQVLNTETSSQEVESDENTENVELLKEKTE